MLVAFSLSFSISLSKSTEEDLTGQAYVPNNQGICIYCTNYCGSYYPHSAGIIVSTRTDLHVKALEEGCTGELTWANPNEDIYLCCK